MLEQSTNSQSLKHEVQTIIQQQQTQHANNMQELYERMMRQMTTMFMPPTPIPILEKNAEIPGITTDNQQHPQDIKNVADPSTAILHRDKKQTHVQLQQNGN